MPNSINSYVSEAQAGDLVVDPQAALDAHKATIEWVGALKTMFDGVDQCAIVEGFPEFSEAQQLAEKFIRLANGETGLRVRLTQFIEVANDLAELFRLSIAKFADTDLAFADYLTSLETPRTKIPNIGHGLTSGR